MTSGRARTGTGMEAEHGNSSLLGRGESGNRSRGAGTAVTTATLRFARRLSRFSGPDLKLRSRYLKITNNV